jgi:phosphoribosyl 1,2-cyclic phosphate phosphodiesterase
MTIRATILGCGSSGGVPRVGGDWGICDPNEPKNIRTRCSLLIEQWEGAEEPDNKHKTVVLIDTSPDLRAQLLAAKVTHIDALLYTHDHADQSHGIDDLRAVAYRMRTRIPTYMDAPTKSVLWPRFKYCFEMPDGRTHPPILDLQDVIAPEDTVLIGGAGGRIDIRVLGVSHGPIPALGFKFNSKIVYTPDVWDIDAHVLDQIQGAKTWICDALRYNPHPTHAHADKSLMWQAYTQVPDMIMTNLHVDMDYHILSAEIMGGQCPAYDGFTREHP